MLRLMLVDDEPRARRGLKRIINMNADARIVGEAGSLADACQLANALKPDAIFLDVELGDGHGFDLLDQLDLKPAIVFVTGHSAYAPQAFDVAALDYLLKPVDEDRISVTLERIRRFQEQAGRDCSAHPDQPKRVHIRLPGRSATVPVDKIALLMAVGDFTRILMADGHNHFVCRLLRGFEAELAEPPFVRVSRSLLFNLDHVENVAAHDGGRSVVSFGSKLEPVVLGRMPTRRLLGHLPLASTETRFKRKG
ncbi:response regulator transcription factor [Ochrobactrum sp. CM-21-5]|nr:LytTR family DNA-binding domain-containing protein [Ochrobactrum sp. CM-21-5]MBC2886282.1 response regulator transcription factor [Ochrobactrum sp. CM-21-5]